LTRHIFNSDYITFLFNKTTSKKIFVFRFSMVSEVERDTQICISHQQLQTDAAANDECYNVKEGLYSHYANWRRKKSLLPTSCTSVRR